MRVSKHRLVASAAVGSLMLAWTPAVSSAQTDRPASTAQVVTSSGSLQGEVLDEVGAPVAGAVVSALGAQTMLAVTDRGGHFEFPQLAPGFYAVRVHRGGYISPRPYRIEIQPRARSVRALMLRRSDESLPVLAAGLGLAAQEPEGSTAANHPETTTPDHDVEDHTELAWRIRQARRGVLKDHGIGVDTHAVEARDDDAFAPMELLGRAVGSPARLATSYFADTAFSGEVNFLTASTLEGPKQLFGSDILSRGITHLTVGAPVGTHGEWTMRGAVTQADLSTWLVAGSYATRVEAPHQYQVGLSYATQRYDGGNPLALRDLTDGSRNVGALYGIDSVAITPALSVTYGARYERYDYLERRGLLSPRVEVTVAPTEEFRVSAAVSRRALAPGAEEFLPPSDSGLWLPPQRTFSSLETGQPFEAERVTRYAAGVERDLGVSTVAFGVFHQDVEGQLVAVFGADVPGRPAAKLGHYFVGNAGDAYAMGCTAEFRTVINSRLRGSVLYSLAQAALTPAENVQYLVLLAPSAVRPHGERIHDVATSLEAEVPETATRVLVFYRASNGFVRPGAAGQPAPDSPGLDSRFDVQVRQSLPMSFYGAKLEMLVAVRNFYRDAAPEQSIYDELLVVRPPKQIVGGVTLHF